MWYVYEKASTRIIRSYKTRAAATAAITRAHKAYVSSHFAAPGWDDPDRDPLFTWAAADSHYFHLIIEQRVRKTNLMTGEEFTQSVNTPRCCDPSSELYWTM